MEMKVRTDGDVLDKRRPSGMGQIKATMHFLPFRAL